MDQNVKLVRLNELCRVVDDSIQWILQRRGEKNGEYGPWRPRSFCTTRKVLLRCIREHAGDMDPAAVAFVETWREQHSPGAVKPLAQINREAAA